MSAAGGFHKTQFLHCPVNGCDEWSPLRDENYLDDYARLNMHDKNHPDLVIGAWVECDSQGRIKASNQKREVWLRKDYYWWRDE